MHKYKEIEVTIRNGLQIIKFNRPQKKNAINTPMYNEIGSALEEAKNNDSVTVTVLTGAGDYYSSGADRGTYNSYIEDRYKAMKDGCSSKTLHTFVSSFIDFPKILVAVVNGPAIGIAVTTLGLCDVVYASNEATFQTPFASAGLSAEGCSSYTFPRIMGTSLASEMLLFDRKINAQEATECGLVSEIFQHAQLSEVWPRLEKYAALPALSMHYTKRLIRNVDVKTLHEANDNEYKQLEERLTSKDCRSARLQFFKRRIFVLDTDLHLKEDKLKTSNHFKRTNTIQYLHFDSCHPTYMKRALPFSMSVRGCRICSEEEDLVAYCDKIMNDFINRGYPPKQVLQQCPIHSKQLALNLKAILFLSSPSGTNA